MWNWAKRAEGLYDIPIKLALFILKDRYGVINLDVPVRGNLDDPSLKFGKLIWTTFKNLMVKVATAPFDALAGQIGADPKDLEAIEYEYLDTLLTPQRQKQLDLLIQLEKQKPGLGIEMVYYNDLAREEALILFREQPAHSLKKCIARQDVHGKCKDTDRFQIIFIPSVRLLRLRFHLQIPMILRIQRAGRFS